MLHGLYYQNPHPGGDSESSNLGGVIQLHSRVRSRSAIDPNLISTFTEMDL